MYKQKIISSLSQTVKNKKALFGNASKQGFFIFHDLVLLLNPLFVKNHTETEPKVGSVCDCINAS